MCVFGNFHIAAYCTYWDVEMPALNYLECNCVGKALLIAKCWIMFEKLEKFMLVESFSHLPVSLLGTAVGNWFSECSCDCDE